MININARVNRKRCNHNNKDKSGVGLGQVAEFIGRDHSLDL